MAAHTQPPVPQPAAKQGNQGKHLAWFWRIVNVAVIVVGIFCGYSLESRHHASATVMQTTSGQMLSPPGESSEFARANGLHQAMQKLCVAGEPKPVQQAHPKRVTLL